MRHCPPCPVLVQHPLAPALAARTIRRAQLPITHHLPSSGRRARPNGGQVTSTGAGHDEIAQGVPPPILTLAQGGVPRPPTKPFSPREQGGYPCVRDVCGPVVSYRLRYSTHPP
ncbi:hypothetical protein BC628DRAFT_186389 [Trametes gibbosa]|nr:hypothetical protein BC628DRAFT_186389 [Trametes gibbosa]